MRNSFAVIVLAASALVFAATTVTAQSQGGVSLTTASHGVQLTLTVFHQQYPFNSLVRTEVSVQNTSRGAVTVLGFPRNCTSENPSVEVLDTSGTVVYPPSPLRYIPPPCPALAPGHQGRVLQPGESVQARLFAYLRGNHIRAVVNIQRGQKTYAVTGASMTLRVDAAESPQAHVAIQPGEPATIDVQADASVTGPPFYEMSLACSDGNGGETFHQVLFWTRAQSSHFVADCAQPLEWHLIAGWPGHTASVVDYVKPKN